MLVFCDGNEAVVMGALKAKCNFFAGYPITPATQILTGIANNFNENNKVFVQAEDEIASIGMCIAASMAGKKCMTATSGPGISLYSENIGLAIMGEVPLVIVDCQRLGPATGSATKDSSGDVQFIRWATSGGYPIVALYPTNAQECYDLTIQAFNLAEMYRTPVFLLLSKELAQTKVSIKLDEFHEPRIIDRIYGKDTGNIKPYEIKFEGDIPNFYSFDGLNKVRFTTSSHDEYGRLTKDKKKIEKKLKHLNKKINSEVISITKRIGDSNSKIGIICYGIVVPSAIEAMNELFDIGIKVEILVIYSIWPCPEDVIQSFLENKEFILVPEMNNGQYAREIQRVNDKRIKITTFSKVDSTLISPEEIICKIKGTI